MVINMTVSKFESHRLNDDVVSLYFRMPINQQVKKNYNNFKNHLKKTLEFEDDLPKGVIGKSNKLPIDRGIFIGKGFHITNISSRHYFHLMIVTEAGLRPEITKAVSEHFE